MENLKTQAPKCFLAASLLVQVDDPTTENEPCYVSCLLNFGLTNKVNKLFNRFCLMSRKLFVERTYSFGVLSLLFWSVLGAVPKIERSSLAGRNRINFIDSDIDRPLGLSIDYNEDHLYWVDDLRDTIERVDLNNPTDRWTIHVGYRHSPTAKLFGLAVYNVGYIQIY